MGRPGAGGVPGRDRPALHWLGFSAALALLSLAAQTLPVEAMDWQPQRAWSEPWRWWSAAFVHYSALHLVANLGACVAVGAFGWAAALPLRWTLAWVVAWPLTQLALITQPELTQYGGLSGLLHAGVAVSTVGLVWVERGRRRWIGAAVLAGMLIKLVLERPWIGPVQVLPEWDIGVAPIGHVAGAVVGLACALIAGLTSPARRGSG